MDDTFKNAVILYKKLVIFLLLQWVGREVFFCVMMDDFFEKQGGGRKNKTHKGKIKNQKFRILQNSFL